MKSIKDWRDIKSEQLGYQCTQDVLSHEVGISTQNLRNYEKGGYNAMNDELLERFRDYFGEEFEYVREVNVTNGR